MKMIIAGGGTGGHLFPGIAIAEEVMKRNRNSRVLFVGTERGIEKRVLPGLGLDLALIDVAGIKGRGLTGKVSAIAKLPRSFLQSGRIIRAFGPDLVLGVGGYASGPAVLTAHLMGLKTAVAEQNAFPGMTNRILGHFVEKIFVTFPESSDFFPKGKSLYTGNPVRAAFLSAQAKPEEAAATRKFNLLIFGGSQGAQAVNQAALAALDHLEDVKEELHIIHQTGARDLDEVSITYENRGFDAEVHSFIMDMPRTYVKANLLVCRAGATSIAELTASGRASVLIPYPFAANDHQTKNAEVLTRAGAAEMIPESELSGKRLAETILALYRNPDRIARMEERSRELARIRAAAEIVDECVSLIDKKRGS